MIEEKTRWRKLNDLLLIVSLIISLSAIAQFIIFVISKLSMSEVNPYIPSTCASQRFCENHKYNTGGLFTAFYNENSSLHCGQQNITLPRYEKTLGGSALPGNVCINIQPGEQIVANNGKEHTDMYMNSNLASMRTGFVEPGTKEMSPGVVVASRINGGKAKKEGFYTDFTSDPMQYRGSRNTSSTAVKTLGETIGCKENSGVEKFCAACASPCGCAVLGVIVALLAIWLLVKFSNCWAYKYTRKKIFTGGMTSSSFHGNSEIGNMNITGGGADDEFAII